MSCRCIARSSTRADRRGGTGREHGQEPGQTLLGRASADHHHMVDREGQRPSRAVEQRRVEAGVVVHADAACRPRKDRHCCGVDGFDRQFVRLVGLQPADVAWHVKGENLPAAIAGELHRPEHSAHDEKEILRRVAFAHHFLPALERNDQGLEVRKARRQELADSRRILDGMVECIRHQGEPPPDGHKDRPASADLFVRSGQPPKLREI